MTIAIYVGIAAAVVFDICWITDAISTIIKAVRQ